MERTERGIGLHILFTLLTCGIYGLYWLYCLAEDVNRLSGNEETAMSAGMVVLLSLVTLNIYQLYWLYRQGDWVDQTRKADGRSPLYAGFLYLLLAVFGFCIVSWALLQHEINQMKPEAGNR